jgi:hypothetical protein
MKRIVPALFLSCFLSLAAAAPMERDLGLGLLFFRVHTLPADLPTQESLRRHPCILDLRYVQGDAAAAAALAGWIKFHSSARTPVILLANSDTGPRLLAPFASPEAVVGLIIIGRAATDFTPDIPVLVDPGIERRAYQALEMGMPINSLINEKVEKQRNDEAMLAREHLPDSALGGEPTDSNPPGARPEKLAPAPLDPVLQRAVQFHRTLVALRRIGPA